MDIKNSSNIIIFCSMMFNCVLVLAICYLSYLTGWWAALLLIPWCILSPSIKTTKDDNKGDEDDE